MKRILLLTFLFSAFLFISNKSCAQLALQWARDYSQNQSTFWAITTDNDGNIYTNALERINYNTHLIKYDSSGILLWDRIVLPDSFFTSSMNFVNRSHPFGNNSIYWLFQYNPGDSTGLIRFDTSGNKIFEKKWGNIGPMGTLPDGLGNIYFIYLNSYASPYIDKYDANGNLLFSKPVPCDSTVSYLSQYEPMSLDNAGVLHVYYSQNSRSTIVTLDANGNLTDSASVADQGGGAGHFLYDNQNNVYATYSLNACGGIVKFDSNLNLIWTLPSLGSVAEIAIDSSANIFALENEDCSANYVSVIHKIDSSGNLLWSHSLNSSFMLSYWATRLLLDGNGSVIVEGYKYDIPTNSPSGFTQKYFLEKFKTNGMPDDYFEGYVPIFDWTGVQEIISSGSPFNFVAILIEESVSTSTNSVIQRYCSSCNYNIKGKIIYDANQNCIQDGIESGVAGKIVEVNPGPHYSVSDSIGNYRMYLPDSDYTVWSAPPVNWISTCPLVPVVDTITNYIGSLDSINFGMKQQIGFPDLLVNVSHTPVRSLYLINYVINYQNLGDNIAAGEVKFIHENFLQLQSSFPVPDSVFGDTLVWNFSNLLSGESRNIFFTLHSLSTITGFYFNEATIDGFVGDVNAGNNFDIDSGTVVYSHDPNTKEVYPAGTGAQGYISTDDSVLLYKIMFQNTGNDTAFDVLVVDTIDRNLDVTSLMIGAVNHPYRFEVIGSGVLKFHFDNILLPDSTTDEPNSYVLINYYIKQKRNLSAGTEIGNFADVYFDFNAAERTNTTLNTILNFTQVNTIAEKQRVFVYPNPASGLLNFKIDTVAAKNHVEKFTAEIYNSTGQKIFSAPDCTTQKAIDISALSEGFYVIVLRNDSFIYRSGIVKN